MIKAESSEVKELFFQSTEISAHFILRGEQQVKMTKKSDHILSVLKESHSTEPKSPPVLLFHPHGPASCLGLL